LVLVIHHSIKNRSNNNDNNNDNDNNNNNSNNDDNYNNNNNLIQVALDSVYITKASGAKKTTEQF